MNGTPRGARTRNRPTPREPEQRAWRTGPDQTGPAVAWNGADWFYAEHLHIWTRTDWTGPDRLLFEREWTSSTQLMQTTLDRTRQDQTGTDRTGPDPTRRGIEQNGPNSCGTATTLDLHRALLLIQRAPRGHEKLSLARTLPRTGLPDTSSRLNTNTSHQSPVIQGGGRRQGAKP